jgi:hypothetical protein
MPLGGYRYSMKKNIFTVSFPAASFEYHHDTDVPRCTLSANIYKNGKLFRVLPTQLFVDISRSTGRDLLSTGLGSSTLEYLGRMSDEEFELTKLIWSLSNL